MRRADKAESSKCLEDEERTYEVYVRTPPVRGRPVNNDHGTTHFIFSLRPSSVLGKDGYHSQYPLGLNREDSALHNEKPIGLGLFSERSIHL